MKSAAPDSGRLFQEDLRGDPFWMLVACQLVNVTTWRQAEPVFLWLRERWPTPRDLAAAGPEDMHDAMKPLGLWRQRSERLTRFAGAWLTSRPTRAINVSKLPGCGKYARDSWAIFVDRDVRGVEPNDGKLNWYLARERWRTAERTTVAMPTFSESCISSTVR